jgi:hypothetical protein
MRAQIAASRFRRVCCFGFWISDSKFFRDRDT